MLEIQMIATERLRPNPRNARTHSRKQIRRIASSILAFGFTNPILTDESWHVLAGHGRLEAAQRLGLKTVRVIVLSGLGEAQKRALALADNRIAQDAGWDRQRLAVELPELSALLQTEGLDISVTGFETPEIDSIRLDFEEEDRDPQDEIEASWASGPAVSQSGDHWQLDQHRLLCGDARSAEDVARLMGREEAGAGFADPPYNVRVADVVGRGRKQHREFGMASGEMSAPAYIAFLVQALGAACRVSRDGALHFVCCDWRHIAELIAAGREVFGELVNMAVWVKTNAGLGSLYRSQHELVAVFRVGMAPHLNNVELGRHGRNRTNVWRYAGVNSFRAGRMDELRAHPTAKPVALVADAIKDSSRLGEVVLDSFCGSGTTIMAAERVGRRGFGVEIDPLYVDVAIRRWQALTRKDAIHVESGRAFDELAADRHCDALAPKVSARDQEPLSADAALGRRSARGGKGRRSAAGGAR